MKYILDHTVFMDDTWWYLIFVVALIALVIYYAVKVRKMKNETEDLKEALSLQYADTVMPVETAAAGAEAPAEEPAETEEASEAPEEAPEEAPAETPAETV